MENAQIMAEGTPVYLSLFLALDRGPQGAKHQVSDQSRLLEDLLAQLQL